jgi:hypothetical protein
VIATTDALKFANSRVYIVTTKHVWLLSRVYIVIPMWLEGVPSNTAMQRILFWQVSFHKNLYWKVIMIKMNISSQILILSQKKLKFVCFVSSNSNDFKSTIYHMTS